MEGEREARERGEKERETTGYEPFGLKTTEKLGLVSHDDLPPLDLLLRRQPRLPFRGRLLRLLRGRTRWADSTPDSREKKMEKVKWR